MAQERMAQENHNSQNNKSNANKKAVTPMIVNRVYKYPVINMAITLGYSQYGKLKSSNVTVGELMTKAESVAAYFWQKVAPIVEKFQEPISKADRLACDTLDFVENKLSQVAAR